MGTGEGHGAGIDGRLVPVGDVRCPGVQVGLAAVDVLKDFLAPLLNAQHLGGHPHGGVEAVVDEVDALGPDGHAGNAGGLRQVFQRLLGIARQDDVRLQADQLLHVGGVGGAAALADGGQGVKGIVIGVGVIPESGGCIFLVAVLHAHQAVGALQVGHHAQGAGAGADDGLDFGRDGDLPAEAVGDGAGGRRFRFSLSRGRNFLLAAGGQGQQQDTG